MWDGSSWNTVFIKCSYPLWFASIYWTDLNFVIYSYGDIFNPCTVPVSFSDQTLFYKISISFDVFFPLSALLLCSNPCTSLGNHFPTTLALLSVSWKSSQWLHQLIDQEQPWFQNELRVLVAFSDLVIFSYHMIRPNHRNLTMMSSWNKWWHHILLLHEVYLVVNRLSRFYHWWVCYDGSDDRGNILWIWSCFVFLFRLWFFRLLTGFWNTFAQVFLFQILIKNIHTLINCAWWFVLIESFTQSNDLWLGEI